MKLLCILLCSVFMLFADVLDVGFQFDGWPAERDTLPVMLTLTADSTDVSSREPVQVLYLMDLSEITTGVVKREFINGALKLANSLRETDLFGVVLYSAYPRVLYPLNEMNQRNRDELKSVLENLNTEQGRDISKTLQKITEQFSLKVAANTISKEVVITTTGPLKSKEVLADVQKKLLTQSNREKFRIHSVSFGDTFDEDLMLSLAEESGGRAYFSREREPESLFVAFDDLAYTITNPVATNFKVSIDCAPLKLHRWGNSVPFTEDLRFSVLSKGEKRYIFLRLTGDKSAGTQFDVNYSYYNLSSGSDASDAVLSEVPSLSTESRYRNEQAPKMIRNSILEHLIGYEQHFRIGGKRYRRDFCDAFKEGVLFPLESAKGRIATEEMNRVYAEFDLLYNELSQSADDDLDYIMKKMKYMLHSNKYGR